MLRIPFDASMSTTGSAGTGLTPISLVPPILIPMAPTPLLQNIQGPAWPVITPSPTPILPLHSILVDVHSLLQSLSQGGTHFPVSSPIAQHLDLAGCLQTTPGQFHKIK